MDAAECVAEDTWVAETLYQLVAEDHRDRADYLVRAAWDVVMSGPDVGNTWREMLRPFALVALRSVHAVDVTS